METKVEQQLRLLLHLVRHKRDEIKDVNQFVANCTNCVEIGIKMDGKPVLSFFIAKEDNMWVTNVVHCMDDYYIMLIERYERELADIKQRRAEMPF